jgi:tetratricopeptide (TPR) repeat protein
MLLLSINSGLVAQSNSVYTKDKYVDTVSDFEIKNDNAFRLIDKSNENSITNPRKSIRYATAAVEKGIKSKDIMAQSHGYLSLGSLYFNIGNYNKSTEYFQLAKDGFTKLGEENYTSLSDKYLNLSSAQNSSNNKFRKFKNSNSPTINLYSDLGQLNKPKSILDTTRIEKKVLKIDTTITTQALLNASNTGYINSGSYNWTFGDQVQYQNQILQIGVDRKDINVIGLANYNLGKTYLTASKPDSAIPHLKSSLKTAEQSGDFKLEQKSVQELAMIYEKKGQLTLALDLYRRYFLKYDELLEKNGINDQNVLTLNEEFLKQEQRISELIETQKLRDLDFARQKKILWSLALIIVVFGLLTWLLVRNIREKQRANMQIKIQSLRSQMNPHFIFNSLNSVNNFISKNDERSANKYLSDFSKLMRAVLKNSDLDFVSLESEIETLRLYLELEHFRFGNKFTYALTIDESIEPNQVQIPPMLVQPYIENAIWHGLRYKEDKGELLVRFYLEGGHLFCTIIDNGIGRKKSAELKTSNQKQQQSTGIKNTKERIELLNKMYKTKLQIRIEDLEQDGEALGTKVLISLPYKIEY